MSDKIKTAVILGGGPASFNSFSISECPKFLLPIANRPLFHYLVTVLTKVGVERFILCVQPEMVELVQGRLATLPPSANYLVEGTSLGSGGSLKEIESLIEEGPFWVVGGNLLMDEDLAQMQAFHQGQGAVATAASIRTQLETPWEMERVEVGAEKQVRAIHRMHPSQEKRSVMRPAGLYLCEPAVLAAIPKGKYFDLKEQVFPALYESGVTTAMWEISGYCRTIIAIDDYLYANQDVLLQRLQVDDKILELDLPDPGQPVISESSRFHGPVVIAPEAHLADGVLVLGPSVIGPQCEIEPGAIINCCVLLGHNRIGRGAYLEHCVVGEGTEVAAGTNLHQAAILKKEGQEVSVWLRRLTQYENGYVIKQLGWQYSASRTYLRIKRLVDLIFSAVVLLITAPLFLLIPLAIRWDSPGKAFFRQQRCGKDCVEFSMYKFRSMVQDSEDVKRRIQYLNEADGPVFKIAADPRTTRVGKILRDTNLDELPQLWNVLKGDMSLVGPRPLSIEEMRFSPRWRDARLSVRPGMTGLWQVKAHTNVRFSEWIINDMAYVNNASPWLDLEILLKTAWKSISNVINLFKGGQPHEI